MLTGRGVIQRAVRTTAIVLVALAVHAGRARAEFPALTRAFDTEDYFITRDDLLARRLWVTAGSIGLATRVHGNVRGWLSPIDAIARGESDKAWGRLDAAAGAAWDGAGDLDPAEFPLLISGGVHLPELSSSLRASLGADGDGYRGADLALETHIARLPSPFDTADLKTGLFGWLRARTLRHSDEPVLDPALGLVIPHLPLLANRLAFSLSAQSELEARELPRSFAMLQWRYLGASRTLERATGRGRLPGGGLSRRPDRRTWRWFGFGAWSLPLDARLPARLAIGIGIRFLAP